MKNLNKVLVSAAVLAVSGAVFAATAPNLNPSTTSGAGAYVGINGGYGKINESMKVNAEGKALGFKTKNDNTGFGGGIDAGYQFTQNIAAEAGVYMMPQATYKLTLDGLTVGKPKVTNNFIYAAAKGILPFSNGFNLFGKLGIAGVQQTGNHAAKTLMDGFKNRTGAAVLLGLGAGYNITKQVSVNVQALGTSKSGKIPANLIGTVGVAYHF